MCALMRVCLEEAEQSHQPAQVPRPSLVNEEQGGPISGDSTKWGMLVLWIRG